MTLQDFAEEIRKQVQEKMGTGYEVECQNMLENNGVRILKLSVTEIGSRVSFLITLNGYYENGDWSDMEAYSEDTAEEITRLYHEKNPVSTWAEKQTEVIKDFSAIRDKIMFRLIHTEMNRKQLETVPHIPFLDLSVVFYIPQEFDDGMCSLLIHNDLMDSWGVTVEQLYELALENTPNMLPIKMAELNMTEEGKMDLETKTDIENLKEGVLYHVSNPIGIFGAAVLMYPDFCRDVLRLVEKIWSLSPAVCMKCYWQQAGNMRIWSNCLNL